jgi:hypothetical protein
MSSKWTTRQSLFSLLTAVLGFLPSPLCLDGLSVSSRDVAAYASALDGTNSSPGEAHAAVVTNFWEQSSRSRAAHAGGQEPARQAFRAALFELQNPAQCGNPGDPSVPDGAETPAGVRLCQCGYPMTGGLFSMLHGRIDCLLLAFLENCTLVDHGEQKVFNKQEYVNKAACGPGVDHIASPWLCYFAPLSTCSRVNDSGFAQRGQLQSLYTRPRCDVFRQRAREVQRRTGLRSTLLLRSELLVYAMRPNERLATHIHTWAQRMGLRSQADFARCLAVHIRHTDKHGVPADEKQHTAFVGAAADLADVYGHDVINYMTDDPRCVMRACARGA